MRAATPLVKVDEGTGSTLRPQERLGTPVRAVNRVITCPLGASRVAGNKKTKYSDA